VHHVATARDDACLAALADEWVLRAAAGSSSAGAFENSHYELTEAVIGRVTPFHRRSGIHAAQVLISHALADADARQRALDGFVAESDQSCDNLDLVGRAGTLLGASILHEAVHGARYIDLTGLTELGNDTLAVIRGELDQLPPIADGTRIRHLGIAHGWAGLLLATLRWCTAAGQPRPASVEERLAQLAELAQPAGAGRGPTT
jgi:serine/threonine-protein kinase